MLYDLRSAKPTVVKDHQFGEKIHRPTSCSWEPCLDHTTHGSPNTYHMVLLDSSHTILHYFMRYCFMLHLTTPPLC